MTLEDTRDMMTSPDYRVRFLAEYVQLKIRTENLEHMLKMYTQETLPFEPSCPYNLLKEQQSKMRSYLDILEERAKIEDVKLDSFL